MIRNLLFIGTLLLVAPAYAGLTTGAEHEVTLRTADAAAFEQTDARIDGNLAIWIQRDYYGVSDQVFGEFVTAEGQRAGEPFLIGTARAASGPPAVSFGGGRYLVVFGDGRGRFVSEDGTMSGETEVARGGQELHVAFNGQVFLVTWLDPDMRVYRGSIVGSGVPFDIMPADLGYVAGVEAKNVLAGVVALNGAFYAIASFVDTNGSKLGGYPSRVAAVPISAGGTAGTPIEIAPATAAVLDLRASASRNDIRVAWKTSPFAGDIRTSLVFGGGLESFSAPNLRMQALSGDLLIYGDQQKHFVRRAGGVEHELAAPAAQAVVDDASGEILIFRGFPVIPGGPNGSDLYVGRIDRAFTPLVLSPRHQQNPDMAAAANNVRLAAWSEYIGRDRRMSIVAARIDAAGATLDADGIDLGASTYDPTYPKVASNGTDWLVAWIDGTTIYARRVSQGGQLLDSGPIFVGDSAYFEENLSVAWDGSNYVIAYLKGYWFHGVHVAATAVRVTAEGQMLGAIALTEVRELGSISIGAGAGGSLVVWGDGGAILSRTATITPVALATSYEPSIAWNGRDFLVAGVAIDDTLRCQLVSDTGVVRTPLTPFPNGAWPDAEPFGDGFLLFWWDYQSGSFFSQLVNGRGELVDGPLEIPGVYTFGASGNLLIYSRRVGGMIPALERVFVRFIEPSTMPRRRAVR